MKISLLLILLFILASCTQKNPESKTKILDFGAFTIEVPNTWTKVNKRGLDSDVGSIAIDSTDTIHFDLGWYSNTLYEYEPIMVERAMLQGWDYLDTTDLIIVNHKSKVDPDKYRKNNIAWDTIDGRTAKIVFPVKSGKGITGIYIDSLWQAGSHTDRFNLYGTNLKPENEKAVLQALRTLKFHKRSN